MGVMGMHSFEKVIEQTEIGYARHQLIYDETGKPVDYIFLAVNTSFERLTGLKRKQLLNRRVIEVLPKSKEDSFDWISYYGKIVDEGENRVFEQYSLALNKWYRVEAFSCEKDCFTTFFTDITHERELVQASKAFLDDGEKTNTYEQITQRMKNITGADYVALNIFLEDGARCQTAAIAGVPADIKKGVQLLGFNPEKREWPPDPHRMELFRKQRVTTFERF